jgi:chromosome segregation ATPase
LDEHKAICLRRLVDASKERDRCKAETQRAIQAKNKLEGSCKELQQQKTTIAKENQKIAEEEQSRHSELKAKFEQAIKDVQEKMDAELEVRQHFLNENEELRGKLLKFTETYEAQEKQLAEQRESREREMEVAQKRLEEHETMCAESKVKTASLEKHNETLRKSQTVLRTELQTILGKFDEFHEAVTGSNNRHGECKTEIDGLQTKLQEYEKENTDLKNSAELTKATEEQKVAEKQRDALERLCDNLQKENKKLQEQLRSLKKKKGKV